VGAAALLLGDDGGGGSVATVARTGDVRFDAALATRSRDPLVRLPITIAAGTTEIAVEVVGVTTSPATIAVVLGLPGAATSTGRVTFPAPATETALTLVWDSAADLGGASVGVVFRVTPVGPSGRGRPTDSPPLTVGDRPPLLEIVSPTPSAQVGGNVTLAVRVTDLEGDPVDITLSADVAGGVAALVLDPPVPLSSRPSRPPPAGEVLSVVWASGQQVVGAAPARLVIGHDDGNPETPDGPALEVTVAVDNTQLVGDARLAFALEARPDGSLRSRSQDVPVVVTVAAGTTSLDVGLLTPTGVAAPATLRSITGGTAGASPGTIVGINAPTETAVTFTWDSAADLGGPEVGVLLRVAPRVPGALGRVTSSPPLTVGDRAPILLFAAPTPSATVTGDVTVGVRVIDPESDPLDLALEVEVAGVRAPLALATPIDLVGISTAPDTGLVLGLLWASASQVTTVAQARLIAVPDDGNPATTERPIEVTVLADNTSGVGDAQISAPARSRDPDVPATATVAPGTTSLFVEVVTATARPATIRSIVGGTAGASPGTIVGISAPVETAVSFVWESASDLGGPAVGARLRVTPASDRGGGRPTESGPLTVGDSAPTVVILAPTAGALVRGDVPLQVRLVDAESDPVDLGLEVSIGGAPRAPLVLDPPSALAGLAAAPGPSGAVVTLAWDSAAQVASTATATIFVTPDDRSAATTEAAVSVTALVDNDPPVGDALIAAPPGGRSRDPDVAASVTVAAGTTDLLVFFIASPPAPATLKGVTGGTVAPGEAGRITGISAAGGPAQVGFVWDSQADLGGPRAGVVLRVQPASGPGPGGLGRATDSPPLTVGDSAPLVQIIQPTPSAALGGDVAIELRIIDAESDPVDLALEVVTATGRGPLLLAQASPLLGRPSAPAPGGALASFAWASGAQLPGAGSARIVVTPSDGAAATTESPVEVTVQVDNAGLVPDALLTVPPRTRTPDVAFGVSVGAGTTDLSVEVVTATGAAPRPATLRSLAGGGAVQGPGHVGGIPVGTSAQLAVVWDSQADLGGPRAGVLLRVRPGGPAGLGRATTSGPLTVGDSPPVVAIEGPASGASVKGATPLTLRLYDAEGDPVDVALEVEALGVRRALVQVAPAVTTTALAALPIEQGGALAVFNWDTAAHVSETAAARIIATPSDGSASTTETAAERTIQVDNAAGLGAAQVAAPARARNPAVPVAVTVAARTEELRVTFATAAGRTATATLDAPGAGALHPSEAGRIVGLPATGGALAFGLTWRADLDLLPGEGAGVRLRVVPSSVTLGAGSEAATGPLFVGDTAPLVEIVSPEPGRSVSGNVIVTLRLTDAESDPVALALAFRRPLDATATAVLLATPVDLGALATAPGAPGSGGRVVDLVWASGIQSVGDFPGTTLTAVLDDGNAATADGAASVTLALLSDGRPSAAIEGFSTGSDESNAIGFDLVLFDPESDPAEVILQWRHEGEPFPDLPGDIADPAARATLLADPARRRALHIMTEGTRAITGRIRRGGLGPQGDRFVAPEVFREVPARLVVGASVEVLHRDGDAGGATTHDVADVVALAYEPEGGAAVILRIGGALERLDPASGTTTALALVTSGESTLALSPDGRRALVGGGIFGTVTLVDLAATPPTLTAIATGLSGIAGVAFAPGGRDALASVDLAGLDGPANGVVRVALDGSGIRGTLARDLDDVGAIAPLPLGAGVLLIEAGLGRPLRLPLRPGRTAQALASLPPGASGVFALEPGGRSALVVDPTPVGGPALRRFLVHERGEAHLLDLPAGPAPVAMAVRPDGGAVLLSDEDAVTERLLPGGVRFRTTVASASSPPELILAAGDPSTVTAGATVRVRLAEVSGRRLATAPAGARYPVVWESGRDLGPAPEARVYARATPINALLGLPASTTTGRSLRTDAIHGSAASAVPPVTGPIAAGDIDGDGDDELVYVVGVAPGSVVILDAARDEELLGGGADSFTAGMPRGSYTRRVEQALGRAGFATVLASENQPVAVGDVGAPSADAAHRDDIVLADPFAAPFPRLLIYLQTEDGDFGGLSPVPLSVTFPASTFINSFSIADLDGDARNDIVCATDAGIFAFYQEAAGAGYTRDLISSVAGPKIIALDVDGDGAAEVIHGTNSGTAEVYRGAGARTFGAPVPLVGFPSQPATPTFGRADLDGDGRLDLIAAATREHATFTWDDATGALVQGAPVSALRSAPTFAGAGDLDGDGRSEVLLAEFTAGGEGGNGRAVAYAVLEGGDGVPVVSEAEAPGFDTLSRALTADVDGDGRAEVHLVRSLGQICVVDVRPRGAPTFRDAGPEVGPAIIQTSSLQSAVGLPLLAAGDVTGDGRADVIAAHQVGVFPVRFRQDASGLLVPDGAVFQGLEEIALVADVDGDGRNDAVGARSLDGATGAAGYAIVAPGTPAGPLGAAAFVDDLDLLPAPSVESLAAGDVDGDGTDDLVMGCKFFGAGNDGGLVLRSGPGGAVTVLDDRFLTRGVAMGDVSGGDGLQDLVASVDIFGVGAELRVYDGHDGGGALVAGGTPLVLPSAGLGASTAALAAADVTGDGLEDVVVLEPGFDVDFNLVQQVVVHPQLPGGGFGAPLVTAASALGQSLALGDMDGDGRTDAVVAGTSQSSGNFVSIEVFLQDPLGRLVRRRSVFPTTSADLTLGDVAAVALADVNGDGVLDLVLHGQIGRIVVFEGR